MHAPKNSEKTTVEIDAASISTTGATIAVETLSADKQSHGSEEPITHYRVSVLEGEVQLRSTKNAADPVTLSAGRATIVNLTDASVKTVKFDVGEWMQRNPLLSEFRPLPSTVLALIGTPATGSTFAALFRRGGLDAAGLSGLGVGTINPSNLSDGGGNEVSPSEERTTICHSGQTLTLPRDAAERHLRNHRDDSAGACR